MAITSAALKAVIETVGSGVRVLRSYGTEGTYQAWLIRGGQKYKTRTQTVRTTAADDAATQGAAVLTALTAGKT